MTRDIDAVAVTDAYGQSAEVLLSEIAACGLRTHNDLPIGAIWMRGHLIMFYCTPLQLDRVRARLGWRVNP